MTICNFLTRGFSPSLKKILTPFAIIVVVSYLPMFLSAEWVDRFVQEDHIYETLSAVFFLLIALLYTAAWFRSGNRKSYLVLAICFLIFTGEEISWGQRIFNTGDSEFVRSINYQNETNIHNLKWIDAHRGNVPFPLSLISSGTLFLIFTLSIWLFVPLIAEICHPAKRFFAALMPIFPWQLFLLMILNFALYFAVKMALNTFPDWYHHPWMSSDWAITEVLEHDTALILLVIAAHHVFVSLAPPTNA